MMLQLSAGLRQVFRTSYMMLSVEPLAMRLYRVVQMHVLRGHRRYMKGNFAPSSFAQALNSMQFSMLYNIKLFVLNRIYMLLA
jgi:hypothetical protein